jgi:predicted O-methyltransferase YrrM
VSDQAQWAALDDYIHGHLVGPDPALENALLASGKAGLSAINVSPNQGKLLYILARSIAARRILEIGTLGGYSAIWLARALPADGKLFTLEINPETAEVARGNIAGAGLADQVEIRVGPALQTMARLKGPFDLVFIDANKDQSPQYFAAALEKTRKGGLIIVDNVVREGRVLNEASADPNVIGIRALFDALAKEPRVTVTAVQTVGEKGHDGFAIALVN